MLLAWSSGSILPLGGRGPVFNSGANLLFLTKDILVKNYLGSSKDNLGGQFNLLSSVVV